MEIGINLYPKWPYEEVIEAFLENGIDRTFMNIEHPEFENAMDALAKAGITVENFHAPFKGQNTIWAPGEEGENMLARLLAGVDTCVKYGVKVMVGHVSNSRPMPAISPVGLERFDRLMAYAKEKGVTIAFLRMWPILWSAIPRPAFAWIPPTRMPSPPVCDTCLCGVTGW